MPWWAWLLLAAVFVACWRATLRWQLGYETETLTGGRLALLLSISCLFAWLGPFLIIRDLAIWKRDAHHLARALAGTRRRRRPLLELER